MSQQRQRGIAFPYGEGASEGRMRSPNVSFRAYVLIGVAMATRTSSVICSAGSANATFPRGEGNLLPGFIPKAFPFGEGFERPENGTVCRFQRERAGMPWRPSEARSDEVASYVQLDKSESVALD